MPTCKGQPPPQLVLADRHCPLHGEPDDRVNTETNNKGVILRIKERRTVLVGSGFDLQQTNPPRQLRQVTDEDITSSNATRRRA